MEKEESGGGAINVIPKVIEQTGRDPRSVIIVAMLFFFAAWYYYNQQDRKETEKLYENQLNNCSIEKADMQKQLNEVAKNTAELNRELLIKEGVIKDTTKAK